MYPAAGNPPRHAGPGWAGVAALVLLGCVLGAVAGFLLGLLAARLAGGPAPPVAGPAPTQPVPLQRPATTPTVLALATGLTADGTRVYGPISGRLAQRGRNTIAVKSASVTLRDFIADAEFTNPYDPVGYGWDYGFVFASTDRNHECRIYVTSDGDWSLKRVTFDELSGTASPSAATPPVLPVGAFRALGGGMVGPLHRQTEATNRLRLLVRNGTGIFFANDAYIASFALPPDLPPGDIQVGSAFKVPNNKPDAYVLYKDFSVWSLESP